jgi:hypothetical protein
LSQFGHQCSTVKVLDAITKSCHLVRTDPSPAPHSGAPKAFSDSPKGSAGLPGGRMTLGGGARASPLPSGPPFVTSSLSAS